MHEIETVDTRATINEMMPKFYDYIVEAELAENIYTAPPAVTTLSCHLYFNEDNVGDQINYSRSGNILIERIDSEFKVFYNLEAAQIAIKKE